jgi:hypothetical protein
VGSAGEGRSDGVISELWEVRINSPSAQKKKKKTKNKKNQSLDCPPLLFKISCPGVFLPDKEAVYLGVYLLNQYLETDCFPPVFPVVIQQSMRFVKVILTSQWVLLSETSLMVIKNSGFVHLFPAPPPLF